MKKHRRRRLGYHDISIPSGPIKEEFQTNCYFLIFLPSRMNIKSEKICRTPPKVVVVFKKNCSLQFLQDGDARYDVTKLRRRAKVVDSLAP